MLLDTSGLLALTFEDEPSHQTAVKSFLEPVRKLVTNYVFAELIALAQARRYTRPPVLELIHDLIEHPLVDVVWGDEALYRRAEALLKSRVDKSYSLCDAVSFVLMRDRGMSDALTADHHFEQEGFQKLLR